MKFCEDAVAIGYDTGGQYVVKPEGQASCLGTDLPGHASAAIERLLWLSLSATDASSSAFRGLLQGSLAASDEALSAPEAFLETVGAGGSWSEMIIAWLVPNAAEVMIRRGRLNEAQRLVDTLRCDGTRLNRAWMLAVAARCEAVLLAARGDIDASILAAERALAEHQRVEMPFERAQVHLLLGQLLRRLRQKDSAATTLRQALDSFETMGATLWAERARAELARTHVGPVGTALLTPSEQRVAELAASGMTNRDVAGALFISPKTVEVNLSRVYRKFGIRSRAELGCCLGRPGQLETA